MFKRLLQKQRGFTLIEMSLGLIVAAVVAYMAIRSTVKDYTVQGAYAQADQIKQIRDGLSTYVQINGTAIVSGSSVSGVSNALAPTVTELLNLQLLPSQASTLATLNQSPFVLKLTVSPSGCSLGNCVIDGYVYVRDPFLAKGDNPASGQYDGTEVGSMLQRLGGDAFARVAPNGNLVGAVGSFNYTNSTNFAHPTITVNGQPYPAGIVGMRIASYTPAGTTTGSGSTTGGPCPGGTINNVVATGTNGNGNGNQCFFTYPTVVLGSSATVLNTQTSTTGTLTVRCLAVNGMSTIQIATLTCIK
ncbi:prepilin-type N-terminal cleavage/methylation domain-containing protein [Limnobacter humi]|uniref:Prepilin-type N-terminal cleavage/methylation domain-containing protein n=1 Tax=Limnobacter humi TaxID=1778671 RepID=A0ABT1WDA9_9BURK|nr:prepilin-type N-terminal cleavage/methylation domain-containing protein [Limnobacter humi]MCQ8895026.1 prepilin-type N-terminal cleavage/methylation domain-containing protein [Limnobacter humi]